MEEKQNKEQTIIGTLLEIEENNSNNVFIFERSMSSDKQQHEFNSSINSETNLLDDNFDLHKLALRRNVSQMLLPTPIIATTIANTKQNASNSTKQSNTTSATSSPNYNATIMTNNTPSSQPQSIKSNSPPNRSQKTKIDIYDYFNGIDGLEQYSKHKLEPLTSPIIDNQRKATLDKAIDPTVLKVREWTKGKRRNIRALLYSLSSVTWPECTWTGCQMSELLTNEQVKKVYKKAVLHIHPDRLGDDPNEQLAKLIFAELNEAWSQFQQESN
ncbi:unnamed protein product [Rotaria sordida]|uniref:J domain-containing protein n=1 Tax=Rotaria sordida TaxID=392033 RepID=A0A814B7Z1_9BILA|nr:unnamed protein product [Rotaria sordida]CAF0924466.1 unnamed protein product [Rotaria sordida]